MHQTPRPLKMIGGGPTGHPSEDEDSKDKEEGQRKCRPLHQLWMWVQDNEEEGSRECGYALLALVATGLMYGKDDT